MTLAFPRAWYIAFWLGVLLAARWLLVLPVTRRLDALLDALKAGR